MAGKGSAPGERRGGRQKGTPNKRNVKAVAVAATGGVMPLDYLLGLLRSEPDPDQDVKAYLAAATLRFEAAKAAAPYCHPRLAQIEHGNKPGETFRVGLDASDLGILSGR